MCNFTILCVTFRIFRHSETGKIFYQANIDHFLALIGFCKNQSHYFLAHFLKKCSTNIYWRPIKVQSLWYIMKVHKWKTRSWRSLRYKHSNNKVGWFLKCVIVFLKIPSPWCLKYKSLIFTLCNTAECVQVEHWPIA